MEGGQPGSPGLSHAWLTLLHVLDLLPKAFDPGIAGGQMRWQFKSRNPLSMIGRHTAADGPIAAGWRALRGHGGILFVIFAIAGRTGTLQQRQAWARDQGRRKQGVSVSQGSDHSTARPPFFPRVSHQRPGFQLQMRWTGSASHEGKWVKTAAAHVLRSVCMHGGGWGGVAAGKGSKKIPSAVAATEPGWDGHRAPLPPSP